MTVDELLTVKQAAEVFQVMPETIRDWIAVGKLRATKPGRHWRIARSELARLAEEKYG